MLCCKGWGTWKAPGWIHFKIHCRNNLHPKAKFDWWFQDNCIILADAWQELCKNWTFIHNKRKSFSFLFLFLTCCCSQSQISDFSAAAKSIYLRWNIEKSVHKQLLKVIYQPMQWNVFSREKNMWWRGAYKVMFCVLFARDNENKPPWEVHSAVAAAKIEKWLRSTSVVVF